MGPPQEVGLRELDRCLGALDQGPGNASGPAAGLALPSPAPVTRSEAIALGSGAWPRRWR